MMHQRCQNKISNQEKSSVITIPQKKERKTIGKINLYEKYPLLPWPIDKELEAHIETQMIHENE